MAQNDRAAALARLAELGAAGAMTGAAEEPAITRTENEVYAGGDVARLLVRNVHLSYTDKGARHYPEAKPGDVVLLDAKAAKRLDALGATVSPDADEEDLEELAEGGVTDEQLAAMSAADLIAHVVQNPDDRDRVRTLELARDEDKRRTTVLKATDPETTAEAEDEAEANGNGGTA